MSKFLISIVGATAIGKTSLSLKLANHYKTSIISADSRQFFKEMSIGTAVPSSSELHKAKHYFIQHRSIEESYDVGAFEIEALNVLSELFKINDIAIMVGGSGLYIDAVCKGLDKFPKVPEDIRTNLNKTLKDFGISPLQKQLKTLDPKSFGTIDIHNPHRVIRALEVSIASGRPYSSFLNNPKEKRGFISLKIGLDADRETIYQRINHRVDVMLESGLLDEAKKLYPKRDLNALNTVGYKELFNYFDGQWTFDFAISEIKKNTRRFAKRQLTWFRKDKSIKWFDYKTNSNDIIKYIDQSKENYESN